jgi:hypothetical protein
MTLKAKALPLLISIVLLNVVILVTVESVGDLRQLTEFAWAEVAALTVFSAISLVLVNLFPASVAERLIFLRIKNYLPGNRALEIVKGDDRLEVQAVALRWPEFQNVQHGQSNAWWYQNVYRLVRDEAGVASSHFAYLFFRDAFSASLMIGFGGAFWSLVIGEIDGIRPPSITAILLVFIIAVLLGICAGNSGRRMVANSFGAHL